MDQAIQACQLGVIDMETLKEGVSYFVQELLNFTIPGVVLALCKDLEYVSHGKKIEWGRSNPIDLPGQRKQDATSF